jgi:hypothetical protein
MKRISVVVLLLAFFFQSNTAQKSVAKAHGAMGYYVPGVQFYAPSGINQFFPDDYPEMKFGLISHAGGFSMVYSNFVLGWESGGYESGPFESANRKVELLGEYTNYQVGYVLLQRDQFFAYPVVSFNTNLHEFYIHQPEKVSSFSAIVSNPDQATNIQYRTGTIGVSLHANFVLNKPSGQGTIGGTILGLEVGYQLPPIYANWSYDNSETIPNAPGFNNDGFYIRLKIGGGGLAY